MKTSLKRLHWLSGEKSSRSLALAKTAENPNQSFHTTSRPGRKSDLMQNQERSNGCRWFEDCRWSKGGRWKTGTRFQMAAEFARSLKTWCHTNCRRALGLA